MSTYKSSFPSQKSKIWSPNFTSHFQINSTLGAPFLPIISYLGSTKTLEDYSPN